MRAWQQWRTRWLTARRRRRATTGRVGSAAPDLAGMAPDGSPVELAMTDRWAVLLFLTSTCYECRALWEGLRRARAGSMIVVTPSAATESAREVAALAPPGADVIMSSELWHAYGVRQAPWCVVVAGGTVVADGPAPASWEEVEAAARPGP